MELSLLRFLLIFDVISYSRFLAATFVTLTPSLTLVCCPFWETYPEIYDLAEGPLREFPSFSLLGTHCSTR